MLCNDRRQGQGFHSSGPNSDVAAADNIVTFVNARQLADGATDASSIESPTRFAVLAGGLMLIVMSGLLVFVGHRRRGAR